ncbi:Hypothetical protein OINT_1001468 [Brucella intermedia LMG 3301]|uniref:Uncharacterized protein n=1 Tax=Brucella intermedia LMG 3301 TaxID=641118 RepID=C4WEC9_9HYPH|nr:Hypothetical protein OINT_1001468 [Brucella intermedia LMG 3301]
MPDDSSDDSSSRSPDSLEGRSGLPARCTTPDNLACMGLACMGLVRSKWSGEHLFAALFPFTVSAEL